MLGLGDLKQTRAYQEALQEGREEAHKEYLTRMVPKLLQKGWTVEEIAEDTGVSVETVQKFITQE